ncbi:MAG: cyanophycinase [Candidatus Saccharicenans sp.]|nr:MAG: cyanophycinase [Candidatus Aminicenantes bacterium]HEK85286.1 cyanophycinase [Candidatus Aminicenantes bacterium]
MKINKKAWELSLFRITLVFLLSLLFLNLYGFEEKPRGHLFIIGGGERPEFMMKKFIDLANKSGDSKIIVLPMASATPEETGQEMVEEFKRLGVNSVSYFNFSRAEAEKAESAALLNGAGGIFFSGGVQTRITEAILNTPVHKKITELYQKGAVIGGTSAGAAVMSELMITGDEVRKAEEGHEFETIQAGNVILVKGLGLVKKAIIDQHFATRKRHNRLMSVIAEHPDLLGVGIDESTAIIINPDETFEVIGNKNVIIYDASRAKIIFGKNGEIGIRGMVIDVLLPGDKFSLAKKKVIK